MAVFTHRRPWRPRCPPLSTPSSSDSTSRSMTSSARAIAAGPSAEAHRRRADHARGRAGAARRCPTIASSSRSRAGGSGTCSRVLIDQSGYNRRLRRLAPEIGRCISYLAYVSPSFCDRLRLLDSTPVPCGQSRETTRRSEFAGNAGYGHCRSHSPLVLGLSALPDLRRRRDADRLGAGRRQHRRTRRRRRDARPHPRRRAHRDRRQGLRRRRVRAAHGPSRRDASCAPTAKTNHAATAASARSANGSNRPSGPAKANSASNATAPAPSPASAPASASDCSPSPPASGTTTSPTNPHEPSPPTAADYASTKAAARTRRSGRPR